VRALEDDPDLGFVGGHIELTVRGREPNSCEIHELCLALNQARHITNGFAATANLFARRSLFTKVGLFDDAAYSGGDKAWGLRTSSLGHRCAYSPQATVLHPARATLGALLRRARRLTAQNPARQRERGHTRLHRALLVAGDEFKTAASRFVEIGKRWRRFRPVPTGGALIVAGLVSLTRAAELVRLALGGTPQR
jgi:GT2 family glycosyltransferase